MPEHASIERMCPYLRGRQGVDPLPEASSENLCLLASSIHLPRTQQREFCLSGRFEDCSRYQRQGGRPIPRYVRGATPAAVRPAAPTPELRPLLWRRPWFATAMRWALILTLAVLFIFLWRMRMRETPPFTVERERIPTIIIEATPTIPPGYLPPTVGPPG